MAIFHFPFGIFWFLFCLEEEILMGGLDGLGCRVRRQPMQFYNEI